ncbi:MAG: hypothetical protein JRN54_10465 [Nitrososphaerota archaeon]|nr:hypothetical protein [Nitrososphaerota archaeon]
MMISFPGSVLSFATTSLSSPDMTLEVPPPTAFCETVRPLGGGEPFFVIEEVLRSVLLSRRLRVDLQMTIERMSLEDDDIHRVVAIDPRFGESGVRLFSVHVSTGAFLEHTVVV